MLLYFVVIWYFLLRKPVLCIAGKSRIACHSLRFALESGLFSHILALPTSSDTGEDDWQPSFLRLATELPVPIVSLSDLYVIPNLLLISLEFDKIIDVSKFLSDQLYNLHFSLLPSYKGCFTSVWPIVNGECFSGVTLHKIDHGIDTGDILTQLRFPLPSDIRAFELYEKYQDYALQLFTSHLHTLLSPQLIQLHPQSSCDSNYYSRTSLKSLNPEINCSLTAAQVQRHVHSLFFPVYQTALFSGRPISACRILETRSLAKPGFILSDTSSHLQVATIDYNVELQVYNREF